jgi:hypothetical protein
MHRAEKNFPLCLMSNGSPVQFPNNSLANFTNQLPENTFPTLENTSTWLCALAELAFVPRFINPYFAPNGGDPTLLLVNRGAMHEDDQPHTLDEIPENQKIYLPHRRFSQFELAVFLSDSNFNPTQLSVRYEADQLNLMIPKIQRFRYCLLIHENFAEYLFGADHKLKKRLKKPSELHTLSENVYYHYEISKWKKSSAESSYVCLNSITPLEDFLHSQYVSIVDVQCESLKRQYFNDRLTPTLATFTVKNTEDTGYSHYQSKHLHFYPLLSLDLTSLSLKLLDITGRPLKLLPGPPTFAKLVLKQSTKMSRFHDFVLRVSSQTVDGENSADGNTKSSFRVQLPSALPLGVKKWRVALQSLTFPGYFSIGLNEQDRTIKVRFQYDVEDDLRVEQHTILLPLSSCTLTELCYQFEHQSNNAVRARIEETTGGLKILNQPGKHMFIELSRGLHNYLGGMTFPAIAAGTPADSDRGVFQVAVGFNFTYLQGLKFERFTPSMIFVYCSLVASSPIGGCLAPVLRLIPITTNYLHGYRTVEFEHLDFHDIRVTNPATIQFDLRGQSGELIKFEGDISDEVLLTLLFSPY